MTTVDTMPSLTRLTAVELRKLVDTRAGYWLLTVIGLLTALLVTAELIWEDREALTLERLLGDAVAVPSLLLPVLGILLVTSEWSQRTNLVTFTLVPNRNRVAVAKIAAGTLAGASATVVTLALAVAGKLIGAAAGGAGGWSLRWSYVGTSAVVLAVSVLMGIAFGMALLNSALAIVVYLVLPTLWTVLGAIIPALGRVADWLDSTVTMANLFGPEVTAGTWARLAVSVVVWVALPPGHRAAADQPPRSVLTRKLSCSTGARRCHHGAMPTLADLVASLDNIPERDPSGAAAVIYARRPWSPDGEAVVLYGECGVESVTVPGFTYLLEVNLCKEVIEVWSNWRDGRTPTLTEAVGAVIWYSEHDAYEPVDKIDSEPCDLAGPDPRG